MRAREGERGGEVGWGNDVRDKGMVKGIFLAGLGEKVEEEMEKEKGEARKSSGGNGWAGLV